ncbi:unnamed protein product [Rhizoctonia solani]|uniref:Casein kinase substrate phosphoprotein PP28 domain-containing protein n=1 Tax=Rhizoctonia solani TaxID=456999 RepID=A0A8H3I3X9_9AGAM|nr:unnamed protein product [Rhizoctonia solani]
MVRGTGKFKQKRGGGRSFSRDMVLDSDGVASGTDRRASRRKKQEEEGDDDEEDEEEEEEEEEGPNEAQPELSRAERKALKKQQGAKGKGKGIGTIKEGSEDSEDDSDLINPNHVQMKNLSISDVGAPRELSRREREAKEKKEAQDRYWKLHVQGKTDAAKSDLARLAKIRAERAAAAEKRELEAKERAAEADKKAAERQSRR